MNKLLIGAAALAVVTPAIAQVAQAPAQAPVAANAPAPAAQQAPRAMKVHTRAEVQAKVAEHFARLDTNRDGFLTKAEAEAARSQFADRIRARVGERREKAFDDIDANKDGSISRAEWDARSAERQQRIAERRARKSAAPPAGSERGQRVMRGMHGMHMLGGQMFDMADANRDSRVSLQEAQAAALRHFDMVDANRDGRITPDERMQMHRRMHPDKRG
jgi:Ca2+-binding EF-hand superfamily protein